MDSIFISPNSMSPRSLDIAALGETRVGILPGIAVAVAKGVKVGTRPAVDSGFAVTVTISIAMA